MPAPLAHLLAALAGPLDAGRIADVAELDPVESAPARACAAVMGAVPFAGSIDAGNVGTVAGAGAQTRRAELVAIATALRALRQHGRMALVVPESVLEGATRAHQALRRRLIEENALHAVIRLRAGLYRPRTRAAVLVAAAGGHTGTVWFCELSSPRQLAELSAHVSEHGIVGGDSAAAGASFFVRREAIEPPQYPLGIERYRGAGSQAAQQPKPHEILHEIAGLEAEILQGIRELVGLLKG